MSNKNMKAYYKKYVAPRLKKDHTLGGMTDNARYREVVRGVVRHYMNALGVAGVVLEPKDMEPDGRLRRLILFAMSHDSTAQFPHQGLQNIADEIAEIEEAEQKRAMAVQPLDVAREQKQLEQPGGAVEITRAGPGRPSRRPVEKKEFKSGDRPITTEPIFASPDPRALNIPDELSVLEVEGKVDPVINSDFLTLSQNMNTLFNQPPPAFESSLEPVARMRDPEPAPVDPFVQARLDTQNQAERVGDPYTTRVIEEEKEEKAGIDIDQSIEALLQREPLVDISLGSDTGATALKRKYPHLADEIKEGQSRVSDVIDALPVDRDRVRAEDVADALYTTAAEDSRIIDSGLYQWIPWITAAIAAGAQPSMGEFGLGGGKIPAATTFGLFGPEIVAALGAIMALGAAGAGEPAFPDGKIPEEKELRDIEEGGPEDLEAKFEHHNIQPGLHGRLDVFAREAKNQAAVDMVAQIIDGVNQGGNPVNEINQQAQNINRILGRDGAVDFYRNVVRPVTPQGAPPPLTPREPVDVGLDLPAALLRGGQLKIPDDPIVSGRFSVDDVPEMTIDMDNEPVVGDLRPSFYELGTDADTETPEQARAEEIQFSEFSKVNRGFGNGPRNPLYKQNVKWDTRVRYINNPFPKTDMITPAQLSFYMKAPQHTPMTPFLRPGKPSDYGFVDTYETEAINHTTKNNQGMKTDVPMASLYPTTTDWDEYRSTNFVNNPPGGTTRKSGPSNVLIDAETFPTGIYQTGVNPTSFYFPDRFSR